MPGKVTASNLPLTDARLTCYQDICIAESFFSEEQKYIWDAVKKLNNIRNELAHKTEPVGLNDRFDDFVQSVAWFTPDEKNKQKRIELTLWALFEAVASLVERPTATMFELAKGKDDSP